jgi:hypothetical protein
MGNRPDRGLGTIIDADFVENVNDMAFDRMLGNV